MKQDQLVEVANETSQIVREGCYINSNGKCVDIKDACKYAIEKTDTYSPIDLEKIFSSKNENKYHSLKIEITSETTQIASRRLALEGDVTLLNFASAKHPGGGFKWGTKAQEEDLARCSALYDCLKPQQYFYKQNITYNSPIYTDYIIYSPKVPFLRVDSGSFIDDPFCASIITSPAPRYNKIENDKMKLLARKVLKARAGKILSLANYKGDRNLVLGAWGCGVFGNDPSFVADVFGHWLEHDRFKGCFDKVVFAVWDPSPTKQVFYAFDRRFG